jgi:tRNA(Ile)-lysidine synthase
MQGIPLKKGSIIRPLLTFTREEIGIYAAGHQLNWREDSSNASDEYSRNFIRHRVVPLLKELNPSLEETFARNTHRLQAAHELARHELDRLRQDYVLEQDRQLKISKAITGQFQYPAPVLLELVREYGFNLDQCMEAVLALHGPSGKQFLSPTHRLVIDREHLIISAHQSDWKEVQIEEGQRHAALGPWVLEMKNTSKADIKSNQRQAILPNDKLHFPLQWRKWRPGDFFFPMGMDHKKKLSDFLVDAKVSLTAKEEVTVLESGGEIAWVVGYRIDNRFRITEETKEALVFNLKTG